MPASALIAILLSGIAPAAADVPRVALRGDIVRIGDIAKVKAGERLIVARLPENADLLELSEEKRAAMVRGRLPGMAFALRHRGTVLLERGPGKPPARFAATSCFRTRVDIAAGRHLSRYDVAAADCIDGVVERRLGYDAAAKAAYAHEAIPAGSYLGRLRLSGEAPVAAGQSMMLRTVVGPVVIERPVTAIQSSPRGQRLFVRTDDGELLTSRLAAGTRGDGE